MADRPLGPSEALAGLAAAAAIFLGALSAMNVDFTISGVHLGFEPIKVGVPAIGLALVSAWIGGRHTRLATFAIAFTTICWIVGMSVAVVTRRPLY